MCDKLIVVCFARHRNLNRAMNGCLLIATTVVAAGVEDECMFGCLHPSTTDTEYALESS